MVERIADMPEGTIGFRADGEIVVADYTEVMLPPLHELVESGSEIRLLFVAGPGFERYEPRALWEDVKASWDLGARHLSLWRRTAVVTEVDWIRKAMKAFGWMMPGELKLFDLGGEGAAKAWLVSD